MSRTGTLGGGIGVASLAAGPTFLVTFAMADLYLRLPAAIPVDAQLVMLMAALMVPATVVGMIIGLPANAIGAVAMLALGEWLPAARAPLAWAVAGGFCGAAAMAVFQPEPQFAFALVITSTVCGWLCSRQVAWREGL